MKGQYLACPLCGGDNLHHIGLIDYTRPSGEDKPIRATSITSQRISVTDDAAVLAPTRRDWVRIFFECETCRAKDESLYLEITQYKGETQLSWGIAAGIKLNKVVEVRSHDLA
jgi:hypothetical protein